jgi:hypothetical protein
MEPQFPRIPDREPTRNGCGGTTATLRQAWVDVDHLRSASDQQELFARVLSFGTQEWSSPG